MTDEALVKALREASCDDHERLTCNARYAACSCGNNALVNALLAEAAARLASLTEEVERLRGALGKTAAEARRYAEFYSQGSDGRNTFIIFAEAVEARAAPGENHD